MRECGECTLCCKLGVVPEIKKPAGEWCTFVSNKPTKGCTIFKQPNLPTICKRFRCFWLEGILPDSHKPLNTKCVVFIHVSSVEGDPSIISILEDYGGNVERDFSVYIAAWKKAGFKVVVASLRS